MSRALEFSLEDSCEDFRGEKFSTGDTIVYAGMSGRSAQLVEAKVLEIQRLTDEWYVQSNGPIRLKLKPTGRYSRWEQHWSGREYTDGEVVRDPEKIRPVLVAARMAMKA